MNTSRRIEIKTQHYPPHKTNESLHKYENVSLTTYNSTLPETQRLKKFGYSTFKDLNNPNNFENTVYDVVESNRNLLPVNRSSDLGVCFNGDNFGILAERVQIKDPFSVSFSFRSTVKNGILMIIVDKFTNNSFFVELVDSQIKATLLIDGDPDSAWSEFTTNVLSNHIWIDVDIKISNQTIRMTVKNKTYVKTHRNKLSTPISGDLFIAGHPSIIQPPLGMRSKNRFYVGETRNFKLDNRPVSWYAPPQDLQSRLRSWN